MREDVGVSDGSDAALRAGFACDLALGIALSASWCQPILPNHNKSTSSLYTMLCLAAVGASSAMLTSSGSSSISGSSAAGLCSHSSSSHRASAGLAARMSAAVEGTERACLPGTLAGRVEEAVFSVYGASGTERVRRSLRALSDGVTLDRKIDDSHELMKQEANSFVEGLTAKPWWNDDLAKYKWAKQLEKNWKVVAKELKESLRDEARLTSSGNNVWGGLDEAIAEYGTGWKTLPLCDRTVWDATNSALFPKTCAMLTKSKVPLIEAFFAKMDPQSDIKPHSDMCNFVLTCHLGIDVPEGQCDLTVGDATVEWRNGKVMLFDTSILHKAENRADVTRYILMMRVYHPELSAKERSALQLVFDCLDEPELLDDREALAEYDVRRRELEAMSRQAWEGGR